MALTHQERTVMNTITYLFWVKACFFLFLVVDIVLFAFNFYVLGGIIPLSDGVPEPFIGAASFSAQNKRRRDTL